MAPISYALLTDVLQFPPDEVKEPELNQPLTFEDKPNVVYQNTNVTKPNFNNVEMLRDTFNSLIRSKEGFTKRSVEDLMEEQLFLSKLMLLFLGVLLLVVIIEKK